MTVYGHLTSHVPINLYCIAEYDSLVDFGTYCDILKHDIEFITLADTKEFGLQNVEGAILTGERHILIDKARDFFTTTLDGHVQLGTSPNYDECNFDLTIDCTFCARDERDIDRFELCLTVLLEGPTDKAVTIMDGPFPSLYPWDEEHGICSLTSAKWTPLGKYTTWGAARLAQERIVPSFMNNRQEMVDQMAFFYPDVREYKHVDNKLAIRAMPRSAADARLVDVVRIDDKTIRIRAGKIDAIFHAYRCIEEMIT